MSWTGRTRAIAVGDTVRYSAAWLRSTGQHTGDICFARGKVSALSGTKDYTIAHIEWDTPDLPGRVNVVNLERLKAAVASDASPGPIFVFGSNLAGRHGKGAALHARQHHGAVTGQGLGLQGSSYAIPTKDEQLRTLSLDRIKAFVNEFIAFARAHPELNFQVTAIGCGLAGYKPFEIAPMFTDAPANCALPPEFLAELGRASGGMAR